jgi:hypothetical protein
MTAAAACVVCHHAIPAWDTPRCACQSCQQRAATQLAALPALYAALDPRPGQGAPSVGSRHAAAGSRPPVRLDVVDLTGQRGVVLPVLTGWARDWSERRREDGPDWPAGEQGQVTEACRYLRWHLDWAARRHPAVDKALREIGAVYRQVHAAATGDRGEIEEGEVEGGLRGVADQEDVGVRVDLLELLDMLEDALRAACRGARRHCRGAPGPLS